MLSCWRVFLSVKQNRGRGWVNTDSQLCKLKACFTCATTVWLAVNHITSVTSGKCVQYSKRIAWASQLAAANQICVIHSMNGCKILKIY